MKKFKLNTVVGNYKIGDEVTAEEISHLLNIKECLKCGWLTEVKPKSEVWEIVCVKNSYGDVQDVKTLPFTQEYYSSEYAKGKHEIHSVKRLRDGVIFSLGDWYEGGMAKGRINNFKINAGGGMFLNSSPEQEYGLNIEVAKLTAKKNPQSLSGLSIDIGKGNIEEAIELGRLLEKYQPTVLQARRMPLPEDFIFPKEISMLFQNGKKVSLSEVVNDFLKSRMPKEKDFDGRKFSSIFFDEPMKWKEETTIGMGWAILSFEMKQSGSAMELMEGVYTRKPDGRFYKGDVSMPARWFIVNKAEIHSVERLRDHSIFTVGEETNYGTIERIIRSWVGIEVHFSNGSGATLESLEKKVKDDRRVKNMTAHNLSPEGVTIKAIVRGDVTDTDIKRIHEAIEGILRGKKKKNNSVH